MTLNQSLWIKQHGYEYTDSRKREDLWRLLGEEEHGPYWGYTHGFSPRMVVEHIFVKGAPSYESGQAFEEGQASASFP